MKYEVGYYPTFYVIIVIGDLMDLLLVIDLQNDFINEVNKESIKEIEKLINSNKYTNVLFTRYVNNETTPCYTKCNYDGCLTEKGKSICIDTKDYKIIDKATYSAYNEELITYLKDKSIKNIYLCGIDVECCVLATAYDLFDQNYNVYVLKDYVYSTFSEIRKNNAIEILKANIGSDYII